MKRHSAVHPVVDADVHKECRSRIESLEFDLQQARRAIVKIQDDEVAHRLSSFDGIKSWMEYHSWQDDLVEYLAGIAWAQPNRTEADLKSGRAMCPLCGGGTEFGGVFAGFAVPEGLARHFLGTHQTWQCPVTEAALAIAEKRLRPRLDAALEEEKRLKAEELEQRRLTEQQFVVSPGGTPRLLDELYAGVFYGPRKPSELEFAERRLRELGFEERRQERVVAWVMPLDDIDVYADLRVEGRLLFRAYETVKSDRRRDRGESAKELGEFRLEDYVVRAIVSRFFERLEKAVGRPVARLAKHGDASGQKNSAPTTSRHAKPVDEPAPPAQCAAARTAELERRRSLVVPGIFVVKPVDGERCLRQARNREAALERAKVEFAAGVESVSQVTAGDLSDLYRSGMFLPVAARRKLNELLS